MLNIEEIKARTETAREEGFGLQQFDDLDALIAEVERLTDQHKCGIHNLAATARERTEKSEKRECL